ncbi:hypothetical protein Tco_0397890 [Tanacetum coccineum]
MNSPSLCLTFLKQCFKGINKQRVSTLRHDIGSFHLRILYRGAARQLLEQPTVSEYVPEDHVPVYILSLAPEDLVASLPRALEVEMRDVASAYYHSLHPSGTPPLLPIPLPAPSTSRRKTDIPRQPGSHNIEIQIRDTEQEDYDRLRDWYRSVRAEIEVFEERGLAYEQEGMDDCQALLDYAYMVECPCLSHYYEEVMFMAMGALKKMMTDKYCPRGEIKKIETEMWNLKVKGTDVVAYSRRFQQLALMCSRMFRRGRQIEKLYRWIARMILQCRGIKIEMNHAEVIEFTLRLMG